MITTHKCGFCVQNKEDEINIFSESEINGFLTSVYAGVINKEQLSLDIYQKVARKLTDGVYKGYGKSLFNVQYGTPDEVMLRSLRENVYIFSAAKDYQMTREVSSLISTPNGVRPFHEFEKQASEVFKTYNRNYLTAEYNSAIAQSRSASMWEEIERETDIYPQLQYETVGDGRVRPEHAALDNIIRPVDDKFWSIYMPPNGWNCRCDVIQTVGGVNTDLSEKEKPTKEEVPDIFRFNAGKTKQVFHPAHPYFDVAKEDKTLARNNFNLPLP